jgi:winged helix DNA-binding protein
VTTNLTARQACLIRATAQHLTASRESTVVGAVAKAVGLQAQDIRAARLQVRVRTSDLDRSDVDAAVEARKVIRTWAMRGTLHMLAAEDVHWIVGLLGPYFAKRLAGRRNQLGLDEPTAERGRDALHTVLSNETQLTRAELVARLADHRLTLDPKSQAPAHLLAYAAMTGLIQRGPEATKDEPTYELTTTEPALPPEAALARLATRYLTGYGPATESDFAAWSGLPLGQARQGFEAIRPTRVTVDGRRAFLIGEVNFSPDAPTEVRLLGHFDTYLLGYRGRELAVPAEHDRRIQAGGGFINPAVLVDGRVEGTWRHVNKKGRGTVTVEPFTAIPKRLWPELRAEVTDLGRFLGTPADWDFPT